MKNALFGLSLFLSSYIAHAETRYIVPETADERLSFFQLHAQKLPVENLAITGRGISLDQTGESLALACVKAEADTCHALQWVYFSSNKEVFAFGEQIELSGYQALSSDEVKAAIKNRLKEYKQSERNQRLWNRITGKSNHALYLMGGYGTALVIAGSNPVGVVAATAGVLIAAGITLVRGGEFGAFLIKADSQVNAASLDQNGWNWSSRPKTVSAGKFRKLLQKIQDPIVRVTIERVR